MNNAVVRSDSWDVGNRLEELGLSRPLLLDIVEAAVTGRNGCTENDPPGAKGWEAYRWGIRRAREILCGDDWYADSTGGIATVVNHERKLRLAYMNADDGAGSVDQCPQNRSRKGANSEKIAARNGFLFDAAELPIPHAESLPDQDGYTTWYLCLYIKGDADKEITVRAELTLLSEFRNGFFTGFAEKIILVSDGDWLGPRPDVDYGEDDDEYEVRVVRK